jgi:hypothetical protein
MENWEWKTEELRIAGFPFSLLHEKSFFDSVGLYAITILE